MSASLEQIQELVQSHLEGTDMYITHLYIKPTNNIKLFIDADSGFTIQKSASINRALHILIEEKGWFPEGDYSLEVSSPGIDEPLMQPRQFVKNLERNIEIIPQAEDVATVIGKLTKADELGITVAVMEPKKKLITEHEFAYSDIKKATIQISFK